MNKPPVLPKPIKPVGDKPGDWMENLQNVADLGHFAGGYAILFTTLVLSPWWWLTLSVEGLFVALVAWKEGYYDLRDETGETWKTSAEDAAGWLLGHGVAWALAFFTHHLP